MKLACPNCGAALGGQAPQGGLRIRGLAITLVKSDGTVHGPCRECRNDVIIVTEGQISKVVSDALIKAKPRARRTRLVFDLTGDQKTE